MPRPALTITEIETYRRRAVDTATRLFAERGYEGVTMRSLAAELGHSPMTPYRYFENKEEIFAAVRAEAFRRFAERQEAAFASTSHCLERLWHMREAYFDFAVEQPNAYRVMFELDQASSEKYPQVEKEAGRAFGALLKAIDETVKNGFMEGDPLTLAHLLWANVHGVVSLHLAGRLSMGRTLAELRQVSGLISVNVDP